MTDENIADAAGRPGWGAASEKTITWHDPQVTARSLFELTGLAAMAALRDGLVAPPPIASHFDFRVLDIEEGRVRFGCTPDASAYNPIGVVHGGLICTLLDTVLGCAVHTTLPARVGYTSIEIKVNYLRPVHAGLELVAHGWVTKPGRRVAFADGEVVGPDGKTVATATGSCLIMTPGS